MALKITDFPKIDPAIVAKLREAKIENADDLLKFVGDKAKLSGLIEKTGIGEESFTRFVGMARLSRVKGIDVKHLNLLTIAGIDGPNRLLSYTPETLIKRLTEVVAEKKLTEPLPKLTDLQDWFAELKKEPVEVK